MVSIRVKKILIILVSVLLVLGAFGVFLGGRPDMASANMGPPREDRGSGIVFDRHDYVRVDRQVLNIRFLDTRNAHIEAIYTMTNTSYDAITVRSMFLSPIYGRIAREYDITANGVRLEYYSEFFATGEWSNLTEEDLLNWEYVLANANYMREWNGYYWDDREWAYVSAVTFDIYFEAGQTIDVVVGYNYSVNVNNAIPNTTTMRYFLTPAKYWKDYGELTINLYLYENQRALIGASLDFDRVDRAMYRHRSYGVPDSELSITVGSPIMGRLSIMDRRWQGTWSSIVRGTREGLMLVLIYSLPLIMILPVVLFVLSMVFAAMGRRQLTKGRQKEREE